jgi:hypothetical protein
LGEGQGLSVEREHPSILAPWKLYFEP